MLSGRGCGCSSLIALPIIVASGGSAPEWLETSSAPPRARDVLDALDLGPEPVAVVEVDERLVEEALDALGAAPVVQAPLGLDARQVAAQVVVVRPDGPADWFRAALRRAPRSSATGSRRRRLDRAPPSAMAGESRHVVFRACGASGPHGTHRDVGALLIGFSLGFFVAAQIGPISLLVMRTVLRGALTAGLAIGAGAAVIDATYAALGQAGAAAVLEIDALRLALGVVGALVLIGLGVPDAVVGVPRARGDGGRRRGGDAAAGVPDVAGRHRVEPFDDRLVGGDLRRRDDRGRGGVGAAGRSLMLVGRRHGHGDLVQRAVPGALGRAAPGRAAGAARRRCAGRVGARRVRRRARLEDAVGRGARSARPRRFERAARVAPPGSRQSSAPTMRSPSTSSSFQGWISVAPRMPCVGGARQVDRRVVDQDVDVELDAAGDLVVGAVQVVVRQADPVEPARGRVVGRGRAVARDVDPVAVRRASRDGLDRVRVGLGGQDVLLGVGLADALDELLVLERGDAPGLCSAYGQGDAEAVAGRSRSSRSQ